MSFTGDVKRELEKRISNARHCRVAEIAALISMCGDVLIDVEDKYQIKLHTETETTAKKFKELLRKTYKIESDINLEENPYSHKMNTYTVWVREHEQAIQILEETKILDKTGEIRENLSVGKNEILKRDCCKRAYLRGAFIAQGSVNNPNNSYHFEIKTVNEDEAKQIVELFKCFEIESKVVARKGNYVVYIKEGEGIIDALGVIEAPVALMEMENVRILKGMSNYYNRQVNCEAANIKKTVETSHRQQEDIQYIIDHEGISYLPEKLRDIAMIRLENPEASLQELGEMMDPPLGKSGVNHRLRKISQIAEDLKGEKNDK